MKAKAVKTLDSSNLKAELWETLLKLTNKEIPPATAIAIAAQSREIMRVVRAEMAIAAASGKIPSTQLIGITKQ